MKDHFTLKIIGSLSFLLVVSIASLAQVTHQITVQNFSFSPSNLTIYQGDIVEWVNVDGLHNVNGTTTTFADNTNSFGNDPTEAPWAYSFTFINAGVNNYQCDIHPEQMQGSVTVLSYDCPDITANFGDDCDDGDPDTENDFIDENCNCTGGILDEPCPELDMNVGDFCDDQNVFTVDDVVTVDCICEGTEIYCPDLDANAGDYCEGVDNEEGNFIGLVNEFCDCIETLLYCPNLNSFVGDDCDDSDPNTINDAITFNCQCEGFNPENFACPDLLANIGDSCDDENPFTEMDSISEDCSCLGTPVYCPDLMADAGDPCDDGNPDTVDDAIQPDCECGQYCSTWEASVGDECSGFDFLGYINADCECDIIKIIDCFDIGLPCDDLNPATINDMITSDCFCAGTAFYCLELGMYLNTPCDDNDISTTNDVITSDCECTGSVYDCPELELNIGDECDDGDPNTTFDVVTELCECIGMGIDPCEGLEVTPGDACDDNDPNTENDVITDDCLCLGTLIYCEELDANAGDVCDDGNETTINDVVTPDCICLGTSIYDCPELQLNFGDACDDDDPNTENDVIQEDCTCSGQQQPPSNDEACSAIPIACGDTLYTSSNFATESMEGIDCLFTAQGPVSDVWYSFNYSGSPGYYIDIVSSFAGDISLYSGDCSNPVYEDCAPSQLAGLAISNLTPPGDYFIRIYGTDESNDFTLTLACTTVGINELPENSQVMQLFGESLRILKPEKVQTVIFYDILGKLVQENNASGEITLKESHSSGIYIAVAYGHSGAAVQSLKMFKR